MHNDAYGSLIIIVWSLMIEIRADELNSSVATASTETL